jgi:hypothetical protein
MKISMRVAIFFALNPQIELTQQEMVRKFNITGNSPKDLLGPCIRDGILDVRTEARGKSVYSAGPTLKDEL